MQESTRDKTQRKILRLSLIATVILIASAVWVNYERNIRHGDKTLTFKQQPLTEVLQVVEKTYAVDIDIQNTDISNCLVTAKFVDKTLEEVMAVLRAKYRLELERLEKRKFKISGAAGC